MGAILGPARDIYKRFQNVSEGARFANLPFGLPGWASGGYPPSKMDPKSTHFAQLLQNFCRASAHFPYPFCKASAGTLRKFCTETDNTCCNKVPKAG